MSTKFVPILRQEFSVFALVLCLHNLVFRERTSKSLQAEQRNAAIVRLECQIKTLLKVAISALPCAVMLRLQQQLSGALSSPQAELATSWASSWLCPGPGAGERMG